MVKPAKAKTKTKTTTKATTAKVTAKEKDSAPLKRGRKKKIEKSKK